MLIKNKLKIAPTPFFETGSDSLFLQSIENHVLTIISPTIQEQIQQGTVSAFLDLLPIFHTSPISKSNSFWISCLCVSDYMEGVSRYIDDTLCRWLMPGQNLSICGAERLTFTFTHLPEYRFFYASAFVCGLQNVEDLERNLQSLIEEMRLNILAVYRARHIASIKTMSLERKHLIIQEDLNQMLNPSERESDQSVFDQMHSFLMKLNREDKVGQITKNITHLTQVRPKAFDREMFSEMAYFTNLFKDQFASRRDSLYISRIIALHYLFKKVLRNKTKKIPSERQISIKIYKTKINQKQCVLGILLGMTVLRETERFDKNFFFSAARACIAGIEPVKDSYLSDRREKKVCLFYIEVCKPSFASFQAEEINALRNKLASEVKKQIEHDVHPIFLPRNEEEVARNLILLSQQLKYIRDLPQVSIHYEKQSESELFFLILMARLITAQTPALREQISQNCSNFKFSIDEIRESGKLKKKNPKETAILRVCLDKTSFFRSDYSVDLLRARGRVAYELGCVIGEYRDFNGGMIIKQEEALAELRQSIGASSQETEILLEDYFYSLRPGIMQTALPSEILKAHFNFLLQLKSETKNTYLLLEGRIDEFFILFVKTPQMHQKEQIDMALETLKIPFYKLSCSFLERSSQSYIGYILRSDEECLTKGLKDAIETAIL